MEAVMARILENSLFLFLPEQGSCPFDKKYALKCKIPELFYDIAGTFSLLLKSPKFLT